MTRVLFKLCNPRFSAAVVRKKPQDERPSTAPFVGPNDGAMVDWFNKQMLIDWGLP